MIQQIEQMMLLQDRMNQRVHPDWSHQGFPWYRAIWTECAELLDHYGWKWWKKQTPDADQVALELIDIWHFGLSILLLQERSNEEIAQELEMGLTSTQTSDFRLLLEEFTLDTLMTHSFKPQLFGGLMRSVGLEFDQLFLQYVGKNVLNFFRQDHGYQDGSYHKQWNGREDNEHLVEVLQACDPASVQLQSDIYSALQARYPA